MELERFIKGENYIMMTLNDDILTIDIPNSEAHINNTIKAKKAKSSVREFYISTDVNQSKRIINFLQISANKMVKVYLNKEKTNEYIDLVQDNATLYESVFKEKLNHFYKSLSDLKNDDLFISDFVILKLSSYDKNKKIHKYLNLPKKEKEYKFNKSFYGILMGEITDLHIYKKDGLLYIYPKLKEDYLSILKEHYLEHDLGRKKIKSSKKKPLLSEVKCPDEIKSYIIKPDEDKKDNTNYLQLAHNQEKLGCLGEQLVLEFEKANISPKNTAKVQDVSKDGLHYDIKSFDEAHNLIKHIEVKTTSKGINEPFYLSEREREYLTQKEEGIIKQIYRVYNARSKKPNFFIVNCENINKELTLKPITYEASKSTVL